MSERSSANSAPRTTLYDYWMALYRRRVMILLLIAVSVVSSLLISSQIRQIYRSQASFYVLRSVTGNSAETAREFAVALPLVDTGTVHAFAEILNGRDARTRILEDFADVDVDGLGKRPIVTAAPTGMLTATINYHDPQVAADLANAFVAYFRKIIWAPALNESVEKRARIEAELAEVTRRYEDARSQRRDITDSPSDAETSTEIATLQQNRFQLDEQIRDMELRLESSKKEIDSLLLTSLRERRTMLISEVEGLQIRLAGFRRMRADLNAQIRRGTELAADLEVQESVVSTLRRQQETLQRTLDGLNLEALHARNFELVTQTALPGTRPIAPDPAQNAFVAVIISLTFGCLLAIYLESRDASRTARDHEQREFETWAGPLLTSSEATIGSRGA